MTKGQKNLTRLWRKCGASGRLYWRTSNPHWRDWQRGDIAMIRDAPIRTTFSSMSALQQHILEQCAENNVGEK